MGERHGERRATTPGPPPGAAGRWGAVLPWPVLMGGAAAVAAIAGWVIAAALCAVGWLTVIEESIPAVLHLATQGWLLAHGVRIGLPGGTVSIAPLGFSLIVVLIASGLATQVAEHAADELVAAQRNRWMVRLTLAFGLSYTVLVLAATGLSEGPEHLGRALLGGLVVGLISGAVGVARAIGWRPAVPQRLAQHRWLVSLPRALAAGTLVMISTGAVVCLIALLRYRERVIDLHAVLRPDAVGSVIMVLGQLAWLPNLVLWCVSWATGAGISLGVDTVVSPAANQLGLLPTIPILGAVPPAGPGPLPALLWVMSSFVAGALTSWLVVREQLRSVPAGQVRADRLALTGALAGILTGLIVTGLVGLAGGDLGTVRLVGLGGRLRDLVIMAPTAMGLAGMATGAVLGLRRVLAQRRPAITR